MQEPLPINLNDSYSLSYIPGKGTSFIGLLFGAYSIGGFRFVKKMTDFAALLHYLSILLKTDGFDCAFIIRSYLRFGIFDIIR